MGKNNWPLVLLTLNTPLPKYLTGLYIRKTKHDCIERLVMYM